MANFRQYQGSQFINKAAVEAEDIVDVIETVIEIPAGSGRYPKKHPSLALQLRDCKKRIRAGAEDLDRLAIAFGPNTDDWPGKTVRVYLGKKDFGGIPVDSACIDGYNTSTKKPK